MRRDYRHIGRRMHTLYKSSEQTRYIPALVQSLSQNTYTGAGIE